MFKKKAPVEHMDAPNLDAVISSGIDDGRAYRRQNNAQCKKEIARVKRERKANNIEGDTSAEITKLAKLGKERADRVRNPDQASVSRGGRIGLSKGVGILAISASSVFFAVTNMDKILNVAKGHMPDINLKQSFVSGNRASSNPFQGFQPDGKFYIQIGSAKKKDHEAILNGHGSCPNSNGTISSTYNDHGYPNKESALADLKEARRAVNPGAWVVSNLNCD